MTCQCEDRPCCGCDADVYQPYDQEPQEYSGRHSNACECRKCVAGDDECRFCGEEMDNEDDLVVGFHTECVED